MKVIILEGPDGAGKTELAKKLGEHGFKYRHEGVPPKDCGSRLAYYASTLLCAVNSKHDIVFDRFHMGEVVYGPVMRNEDHLTYYGMTLMNRLIRGQGVTIRLCLPPFDDCFSNWHKKMEGKNDYVIKPERFVDVYYRYQGLLAYDNSIRYNYLEDEKIQRTCLLQEVKRSFRLPGNTVGNPLARILVVGETPGGELDLSFFAANNSPRFINEALWEAGLEEDDLAFVNAIDGRGRHRKLDAVEHSLPKFRIALALGQIATSACEHYGIPYLTVPHPAHWKRFHHGQREQYVAQIAEVKKWL